MRAGLAAIMCVSGSSAPLAASGLAAEPTDLLGYVDPFIGTAGEGAVFPGATAPFGMLQWSPDTRLGGGGYSPATTAVLITTGDDRADWLRAGQALHRLLLRAATGWVFASLHTQPLEHPPLRAELRTRLGLPGAPQMLLQLGRSGVAQATARRPVTDLLIER